MNSLIAISALLTTFQTPTIDQFTQPIKDISFSMDVKTGNQPELRKISGDFGEAYRFEHMTFRIKDSFQIRGDTKMDDMAISMIMNDGVRIFRAPSKRISYKTDVRKKPGQRQTLFEFGIITPQLFDDFLTAKFVRNDRATGDAVFDVGFNPKFGDSTRYRIWISPDKKYVTKKEWYSQKDDRHNGELKATFFFSDPEKVGACWVPTVATVRNAEGNLAGALSYSKFKINIGLDDSLFK
jgi:hypothetical protein